MFISSTGDMRPVQLDQIESVEEHAGIMPALSDTTERAALTRHRLTIDNARPRPEPRPRPPRSVKSGLGQLVAGAVVEPHPCAVLAGDKRSRRRASVPAWPPLYVLTPAAPGSAPRDPTRWAAHQRTQKLYPDLSPSTGSYSKKPLFVFSPWPSCLAAARSALLVSPPSTQLANPRARPSHATFRRATLWVISGRVRRALRPIRGGVGWSPVPGHAGHQRHCSTPRPAVSLRGSLQAGH